MATFFTSDWHLGDDRIQILDRPFINKEEMENEFIKQHNNIVTSEDLVYIVGDIVCNKSPEYLSHVNKFNGKKILIRGNHDSIFSDDELLKYFVQVIPDGEGIDIDIDGVPCYIVHYPTRGKIDKFNLVGHIHTSWKHQLNMLNIGIDVNHFKPVNSKDIKFQFNAISKYYDEDRWCAYSNINTSHTNRIVKGTYFEIKNK